MDNRACFHGIICADSVVVAKLEGGRVPIQTGEAAEVLVGVVAEGGGGVSRVADGPAGRRRRELLEHGLLSACPTSTTRARRI